VSRCALFGRLAEAERVVQISAPAGSGKTVLVRSWIAAAGLAQRAAWVPVDSQERDPRRFWISVANALRDTSAGSALVRPLTAAPDLDGWAVMERLLTDLAPLEDRLWLVIDDAHLLGSGEVLPQLELLVLRAPPELRLVLATRHDLRLGLHRLRLEGELTEIRAADLRFSLAEARALFIALHGAAAQSLARNGYPMEAVRHAQAAQDWGLAARLLSDHWPGEYLGGRAYVLGELLARFPGGAIVADAELTAVRVADDLVRGSLDEAGRDLALTASALASMPAERRGRVQVLLSVLRFSLARRRMDIPVAAQEAQRLLALMNTADTARLGLGEDLRAAALISLGATEIWALHFADAERHLEQGVDLARRIGRPYLEFTGLTYWAHGMMLFGPDGLAPRWCWQAVELAERHGWGEEPLAGIAYTVLGGALLYQGQLADAESWLERAEHALRTEVEPAAGVSLWYARAALEMARGRYPQALAACGAADTLAAELAGPHTTVTSTRARMVQALVRAGQGDRAAAVLARLDTGERAGAEMRTAAAALHLAQGDPQAAAEVLAPVLAGSVPGIRRVWMMTALLAEAAARDALGDRPAAGRALESALDIAESTGILLPFLLDPAPALLEWHRRYRTVHSALVARILDLLAEAARPAPRPGQEAGRAARPGLLEPLTDSEVRILRYLPTRLTAREIASELFLSVHTVTTHMRHLYAKLGVHRRRQAVESARALGLLAPTPRGA
jgi:LuxR family maltose regulon positive regulatory protein